MGKKIYKNQNEKLSNRVNLQGIQRISLRDKIFREIIANMLIHREYINAYPSTFIIYKNKVVAKNANKAHHFRQLTPNNYEPFPKNPDIARIFTQIGHSEELGTGIPNVYKYSKPYSGNDNIIFKEEDIFITEVPLKDVFEEELDVNDGLNDGLNERQIKTLKKIKKNPGIKIKQLSEILEIPIDTLDRYIRIFVKKKIIERRGSKKTGGYYFK